MGMDGWCLELRSILRPDIRNGRTDFAPPWGRTNRDGAAVDMVGRRGSEHRTSNTQHRTSKERGREWGQVGFDCVAKVRFRPRRMENAMPHPAVSAEDGSGTTVKLAAEAPLPLVVRKPMAAAGLLVSWTE